METTKIDCVCPICYEENDDLILPIKLKNCGHSGCYECLKSYFIKTNKFECPMCRTAVDKSILEDVSFDDLLSKMNKNNDYEYQWYYSGRHNKYWEYSSDKNKILNDKFKENKKNIFDIEIMGDKYIIDFNKMIQHSEDLRRVRKIKCVKKEEEDSMKDMVKGIAGIKINGV